MKQRRQFLCMLFVSVLGMIYSTEMRADDFMENQKNYTCIQLGAAKLQFDLATYADLSMDEGISEGHVYVSVDGGPKQGLFDWHCNNYRYIEYGMVIKAIAGGTFQLTGKVKDGYKTFTSKDDWVYYEINARDDDEDHYTTTVTWDIPYEWRGKKLKISMWAHIEDRDRNWYVEKDMFEFDCPAASPVGVEISSPMLSYDQSNIGQTMFTYSMNAYQVQWAKLHYTDDITGQSYTKSLDPELVGFAYIPMNRPWRDVYVEAKLIDAEKNEVPTPVQSKHITANMLHVPKDLAAAVRPDGKVELTWTVDYEGKQDLYDGDFFEIQRNVYGNTGITDSYWTTISMENPLVQGQKTYTFIDEGLVNQYKGQPVAYRVRRSATSVWSWANGSGSRTCILPTLLELPSIENATAHRSDTWTDDSHVVNFAYEQRNDENLMTIASAEDWRSLCDMVKSGETNIYAKLITNLTLTKEDGLIGDSDHMFKGRFDGNGYTLTLDYDNINVEFAAPFRYVRGGRIQNLKVTGIIGSSQKFSGSLVGWMEGSDNELWNCVSTVEIKSTVAGDGSNGGLIGYIANAEENYSEDIYINDCLFAGKMTGKDCDSNGGFVGWLGANNNLYINCSLFDPTELSTKTNKCATFARHHSSADIKFRYSYYRADYNEAQGNDGRNMTDEQLISAFESYRPDKLGWSTYSGSLEPIITNIEAITQKTFLWDERAKLKLLVHMHGENSVETREVDLSKNETAINDHKFSYELSRNCVEYSFDLMIDRGTSPMPVAYTRADSEGNYPTSATFSVKKTDTDGNENYRYVNSAQIQSFTAATRQSSVELSWTISNGENDYYRILRRPHSSDANAAWTDTIATNLIVQFYEDKTVLAQQSYDYRVESIFQCEGTNMSYLTCTGQCEPTGMIAGYVRMADGTAMAGVTLEARPNNVVGAETVYYAVTDSVGYYEFKGLPYNGTGTYNVTIPVSGDAGTYTGPNQDGAVTFTTSSNLSSGFNFFMDTYFVYSGNVYYEGTSIPVPGVSFKLDGNPVHDASRQLVTTDNQGAFELSIPRGQHSVQAVKTGHRFADDGYLLNPDATDDPRLYNFVKNVASVYLWDSTTVLLHGRVVGGDTQGSKPLGASLSTNNLGDSLKIVMQLEGDNTSWIVRNPKDDTVKSLSYIETFGNERQDTAQIDMTRHTITIRPDAKTGEYQLRLHPAKYKVIEVSAQGYATLFQAGKIGETLDLTDYTEGSEAIYNRIYHAMPDVEVRQYNSGNECYYGMKYTVASDIIGNRDTVMVWNKEKDLYSFQYPVFMSNSPYGWMLQACEKYFWNNKQSSEPDIVKLKSGKVTIKNELVEGGNSEELALDSTGYASYVFTPKNATFALSGENALKTVNITLEYDETYYDIKPFRGNVLRGYVMAVQPKTEGQSTLAIGVPQLIDILRDPPGGGSSSYIETGSKLSYSYSPTFDGSIGMSMTNKSGTFTSIYAGTVAAPLGAGATNGTITEADAKNTVALSLVSGYNGSWVTSYTVDITERIQTQSNKKWVGGKADLFIGTNENVIIQDAIAVRAIPEKQYLLMKNNEGGSFQVKDSNGNTCTVQVRQGAMSVLAKGQDSQGNNVYLVRDEVLSAGNEVKSTFIHSQNYIENEMLPAMAKARNALILPMDTAIDCQSLADSRGEPVFQSIVPTDDPLFGGVGKYMIFYPSNQPLDQTNILNYDKVQLLNNQMGIWLDFLARNEMEKLTVQSNDLVKNYDFDGGASSIQYNESFSAGSNKSGYVKWPGLNNLSLASLFPSWALPTLDMLSKTGEDQTITFTDKDDGNKSYTIETKSAVVGFKLKFTPVLSFMYTDKSGRDKAMSKKIGFTLSSSAKSSLNVDVYRTRNNYYDMEENPTDPMIVMSKDILDQLRFGQPYYPDNSEINVYSSFVFRTRGGVTSEPYEGERTTKWYQPGTVLDVATIPADKPRIWVEQSVVSNVPYNEPARFTLHMANETDYPDRASITFNYYLEGTSNPNGAKVFIDGAPVTAQGYDIALSPARNPQGEVNIFTKQMEVYAGEAFDYEDLTLCLYDPEDPQRIFEVKFSAHFVPAAGKVNITSPGDKWIVNTESPYDGKKQRWYLPVTIEGFDVNYRGFDHIELQYKLSTQGDKDWVNVCSYYADRELMAKASGVCDTIPANGKIIAPFFGETDPIEQNYDLRAVNYCRHGGGFLTYASPILTGIKDTRLPVAFGTPSPVNGILDIGDDIKITFSEPIAGNYLSNINNFEVLGTPLSNDISTSTALTFNEKTHAFTMGERNLMGKSFTVDVMLNPAQNGRDMAVFSHGGDKSGLCFGLSSDGHMTALVNGVKLQSESAISFNNALREVAYVLEQRQEDMVIHFFDGSMEIGNGTVAGLYQGTSNLFIGTDHSTTDTINEASRMSNYEGDMLEFRLWNRAMQTSDLNAYGKKVLTGYESGLLDYYEMNEGEGNYCYDRAPGSYDLCMIGHTWKRPEGIAMQLDGTQGLRLNPDKFSRSAKHDYTMMFWFRTNDANTTLLSNGEAIKDTLNPNATDQLNIGLKKGKLYVRSSGYEQSANVWGNDGEWHHFAMTVSRPRNVTNIYFDKKLVLSCPSDSMGGIQGDHIALGATYKDKNTPENVMTGHIDEVGMFESVLPLSLIQHYATHTPLGTETSLLAYLNFGQAERQTDNTMRLEPTGVSLKRYKDNQGNITDRRDTLLIIDDAFVDRKHYAPMNSTSQLDNLKYGYVAKDNELFVNLEEPDFLLEKTNVYITVKEVADLQGNLMASPVTLNLYVYRNPLRWDVKNIKKDIDYGHGFTFEATVKNLSGQRQNFDLQDIPLWITPSITSGIIDALDEEIITFEVSPYINVGTYNEQISLVGGNGMTEVLPVTLKVRGDEPQWTVSDELKNGNLTMQMVARVTIDGVIANAEEDLVGVFDSKSQVLGTAHIELDNTANANEALAYITIYGYTENPVLGTYPELQFKYFDASAGLVYNVMPSDSTRYTFSPDQLVGSAAHPVELVNMHGHVQTIPLRKGWNWVSFNIQPKPGTTVSELLDYAAKWEPNDLISAEKGTWSVQYAYTKDEATGSYKWDKADEVIQIDNQLMYRIYSNNDKSMYVGGSYVYKNIDVHKGWNRISYLPFINLPIAQALSEYTEFASEGDVIKSQDAFAMASLRNGEIIWKGSLKYLESGKGYMLKRQADSDASFHYPLYFSDTRYSSNSESSYSPIRTNRRISSMNIVAAISGVEVEAGDRLVVYSGTECCAEAEADADGNYYLNIGGDQKTAGNLTFSIERGDEIVALMHSQINYTDNKVMGTPNEPTVINFVGQDQFPQDGNWYRIDGIKFNKRPTVPGCYIHNGIIKIVK